MLKRIILYGFFPLLFIPGILFGQQSINAKYAGRVEYVFGAFDSFNPPAANDSVEVSIAGDSLQVKLFSVGKSSVHSYPSDFKMPAKSLLLKEEYKDIITPTEEKATGSYNVKYSNGDKNSYEITTIQIVHMSDGKIANLAIVNEHQGFVYDILIARLNKIN